jgi:hypothetical protein
MIRLTGKNHGLPMQLAGSRAKKSLLQSCLAVLSAVYEQRRPLEIHVAMLDQSFLARYGTVRKGPGMLPEVPRLISRDNSG